MNIDKANRQTQNSRIKQKEPKDKVKPKDKVIHKQTFWCLGLVQVNYNLTKGVTVRPSKKPTNLSQSGEVPKGGWRMKFWKELFPWKGGAWGCEGCYGLTFFHFSCFGLLLGTLKWDDFVPTNFQMCHFKKVCEKPISRPRWPL
jgi:hypothetical protein